MSAHTYRSSRPDTWVQPRPYSDASARFAKHGAVLPMDEPGLLARWFGTR